MTESLNHPIADVALRNVSVHKTNRFALANLSVQFSQAGVSVVLGPNGAGKSLLLRVIAGWIAPTSGRVVSRHQRSLLISSTPPFLNASVAANLWHAQIACKTEKKHRRRQREQLCYDYGLPPKQNALTLSSGQAVKLALARLEIVQPSLLLLDEPTANLDPEATAVLENRIRAFNQVPNHKTILVTHQLRLATRLASEIIFLDHGEILSVASKPFFESATLPPRIARFLEKID